MYGPIDSNDQFAQIIERFNRAGQVNKMTIIQMAACPMEWEIYKGLRDSGEKQASMLDLYRMVVDGHAA
jgi:hypothetical protein